MARPRWRGDFKPQKQLLAEATQATHYTPQVSRVTHPTMAECQQGMSDQKEPQPCHNPSDLRLSEGGGLVPLSLPPGVTSDIAARLTTSILLRRAYCSSRPWDQWLLLASLKILHGQATPTLDSVSLHLLQGTPSEKPAECGCTDDAEEDAAFPLTKEQMKGTVVSLEGKNTAVKNVISDGGNNLEMNHNSPESNLTGDKTLIRVRHTPERDSSHENTLSQTSNTPPKDYNITVAKNTLEHNFTSPKENNMNVSKASPMLNYTISTGYSHCKDKIPQALSSMLLKENHHSHDENPVEVSQICCRKDGPGEDKELEEISHACRKENCHIKDKIPTETYLSCKKSPKGIRVAQGHASVQVTPKKLGIYTTKWVQVRLPRRTEQGVQTEHLLNSGAPQTENSGTQTHFPGHVCLLSSASVDNEVQTVLISKKDKSTQVDRKSKTESRPSHPVWKMVPVSGIPKRQKCWAHGSTSEVKYWDGTQKANNYKTLIQSLDGSKAEGNDRSGWLFHGRPMLNSEVMKPVDIPLECLMSLYDPALLDPRLSVSS